jgi:peptide/nickel transport system substrate-binding protein
MKAFLKRSVFAALAAGTLTTGLVIISPSTSGAASTSGGTATMALDETLAGFNINTSASSEYVLQEIMDIVWPQAFITTAKLQPVLNNQLLTSATQTSSSPQTIVYKLNPKAVWSDGTPITADDFIYNWQAQSGNTAYTDIGGKPYDTASSSGYNQIQSVVGSAPSGGAACDPGTTADRNVGMCPNGRTITVTFKPSFADWRALFSNIVPAHISRTVGWNTGFAGPAQAISGSWYTITSYNEGQSAVLTRNPTYWGTKGKLAKIVFQFITDDTQEVPAMQNNEVQVINPSTVSLAIVQNAAKIPAATKNTDPGLEFEHFDFNEANAYLAKVGVRKAIAYGTNVQTIINRTVGEVAKGIKPLGSRMLVATQPGYQNGEKPYAFSPKKAESLLKAQGFKKASDGYFQPNYGPLNGKDLTFTIQSTSGNAIRASTEELFQSEMKAIGIKINIQNYDASTFFGTNLVDGLYDIAEFAWVTTPFVSGNQALYCSYTNATNCGENWLHYANPKVDKLLASGASAATPAAEVADYNKADTILWNDMVTLPLYQKPQFFAWANSVGGVVPNTSSVGVPWNGNSWHTTAN